MITLSQQAVILAHARATYPRECCGLVGRDGVVYLCDNVAPDPRREFEIAPRRVVELQVAAIYHSHVDGMALPSAGDRARAHWYGIPYLIVALWPDGRAELRAYVLRHDGTDKRFRGAPAELE